MKKNFSGQSIVEMVVAVGIVVLLTTGLIAGTTSALRFGQMAKIRTKATQYAQEGQEMVRMIRDTGWDAIPQENNSYCLSKNQTELGEPSASCPMNIDNTYSRTVSFSQEPISAGVCTESTTCRKVTVTVSWTESGQTRSESLASYLTNWMAR